MSSQRRWDLGAIAVIVTVVAGHLRFLSMDGRIPNDPGLYYQALMRLHAALTLGQLGQAFAELGQPAGWYNLLLAGLAFALGRSPGLMSAALVVWVALGLLAAWRVGRHLGGPSIGFAAVALVGAAPMVVINGRTPWIHAPELALVLGALAAWLGDPALLRRRTVAALVLTGSLAISLRQSGMVWMAPLGVALLWPSSRRPSWTRLVTVLASWVLALLVPLLQLETYLDAKLAARDRYANDLPSLGEQLTVNLGLAALVIGAGGVALALWLAPKKRARGEVILYAWTGLALALWVLFRAGIDNFPILAASVGGLAALGLARAGRLAPLIALLAFVPLQASQWVAPELLEWARRLPGGPSLIMYPQPRNWVRPWQGFGWPHIRSLIDATCGPALPGTCTVVVDQGLFAPYGEDPGRLQLFLTAEDRVRLISLREGQDLSPGGAASAFQAAALVDFHCVSQQPNWEQRFPAETQRRQDMVEDQDLAPAWARLVSPDCAYIWYTPGGQLLDEAALPSDGLRIVDGDLSPLEYAADSPGGPSPQGGPVGGQAGRPGGPPGGFPGGTGDVGAPQGPPPLGGAPAPPEGPRRQGGPEDEVSP